MKIFATAWKGFVAGTGLGRASAIAHHGASLTSRDLAGWTPPRGTSPDLELLPELSTLMARARDLDRNNGVARSGINAIIDNVVGTGLRLSARPNFVALGKDREWAAQWAREVEALWSDYWWSTACSASDTMTGDQLTEQALRAQLTNGAALALPLWLPDRGDGWATKVQMVEADRLCNPTGQPDTTALRGGIEFDPYGMPLAYHIRSSHPGDVMSTFSVLPTWVRIPRRTDFGRLRVIHNYDPERAGQSTGKPILAPVMSHFKQVDRYIGAELMAAVVNGMVAGTIETPLDQESILELFNGDHEKYLAARKDYSVRMEAGTLVPTFPGDTMKPFIPARPAAAFGAFVENVFRIVAAGLDLPYELLLKDFSKTNYSSARAALLEAWRSFNRRRDRLAAGYVQPIYALWLEEAVGTGRIEAPGFYRNRIAYLRSRWIGPGRGWVDPVKEATAAALRMQTGVSTLEQECAEQGLDWREVLEQRALELEEMERLGLPTTTATTVHIGGASGTPGDPSAPGTLDDPTADPSTDPTADPKAPAEQADDITVTFANPDRAASALFASQQVAAARDGAAATRELARAVAAQPAPVVHVGGPVVTVEPAPTSFPSELIKIEGATVHIPGPDPAETAAAVAQVYAEAAGQERAATATALADVNRRLDALATVLAAPVKPIYDEDGQLIGAQRVPNLEA